MVEINNKNRIEVNKAVGLTALLSIVLLSASLVAWPTSLNAGIFKCVDANGDTSYSQTPCQSAEQTAKVISNATQKNTNVDCRIANNFARRMATGMRRGQSSGEMFDSYGGIDALPRTSIGIINYVYSHIGNVETGVQRITALSAARCSAGSYGPVGCDDFPYNFVAELGGCEQAAMSIMPRQLSGQYRNNWSASAAATNAPANTQSLGVRTATDTGTSSINCQKRVQAQMKDLFEKMRSGQSASAQGRLNDKKARLRNQLSAC